MTDDRTMPPAPADDLRVRATADLRRTMLVRGIANAMCVPVALLILLLVHNATVARDGALVLCMVAALVVTETILRRGVRAQPGNVVMGFAVFFGFLGYGLTVDNGPDYPWVYPAGMVAILLVWVVAGRLATPVPVPGAVGGAVDGTAGVRRPKRH